MCWWVGVCEKKVCNFFFLGHGRNFLGRNVHGRNVLAETSLAETSVAEMSEHHFFKILFFQNAFTYFNFFLNCININKFCTHDF